MTNNNLYNKAKEAVNVIDDLLKTEYIPIIADQAIEIFILCEVKSGIEVRNIMTHPKMKQVSEDILDKIIENPRWIIDDVEHVMLDDNIFKASIDFVNTNIFKLGDVDDEK